MSGLRRTASAVLGAAGIVLAMASPAVAATNITILTAGPDRSSDPYNLTIVANDGNGLPIQTMTAHVFSATTQVPPVAMTPQSVSNPASQTWVASPAILASTMLAGTYTVTVDVNDGTESDQGLAAGSFSFAYVTSSLTVTAAPPSVTKGSQNVTFSGTLTGIAPGGTPVGIANAPVDLSINGKAATQIKTTDVNGDFTYTVTGVSQKTAYAFSVGSSATYPQATDDITVVVDQARTRISHIKITPAHLKYGQNAKLRATVQYLNGSTWTALPRTAVHLAAGKVRLKKVTTTSNGTFTATLPSTHGPAWTAVVNSAKLTLRTSAMGNLSIALPLKVTSFSAHLGVNDKISASGCLEVLAPLGGGPGTFVEIQYSHTARGPWRSLGTLPLDNGVGRSRTCRSHDQAFFRGTLPAKLANAYYRADFAATYSYQAAVSKVVHAWKYPTRIVSFTANKHSISKNGTVRFRGRLEVRGKSWRPWGGQLVTIWYSYKGTSIFVELTSATTNSRGYFTASAKGTTGNFVAINYAFYAGDATHLACRSRGIPVRITNDGGQSIASLARTEPGRVSTG